MDPNASERRGGAHYALLALGLLAPAGLLLMRRLTEPNPDGLGTHAQLGLEPCRFEALFDMPCPGCGVTTSVAHFADGAPLASLATQPLGSVLAILALVAPVYVFARHLVGADLERDRLGAPWRRIVIMGMAIVLGAWAYKLWVS
jgi:hypothetical protein